MSEKMSQHIDALDAMKKYPPEIFYKGNLSLLDRPKVAIVGTRRPSTYTRQATHMLAQSLAKRGVCIVSGAAMGVDTIAHNGAGAENTIAVMANGLDIHYPAHNTQMIKNIEEYGLTLSQFNDGFRAMGWSFVVRNELVVALGDILIVTEADLHSGSMRSVEYALKMGKEIFVLSQRIDESLGTNSLLHTGKASIISDIESFVSRYGEQASEKIEKDEFFYFCQSLPTFDDAVTKFGDRVYEAELEGLVTIDNGIVRLS